MSEPSTDVAVPQPAEVVGYLNPITGQLLAPDAPTDAIAEELEWVREQVADLQSYARALKHEVLGRMDHERTYTARLPRRLTLTGDGPRKPDYDGERLYAALVALVPDVIGQSALDKAVKRETAYRPMKGGITALLKVDDERVAAAVKAAEVPNNKPRNVQVKRSV